MEFSENKPIYLQLADQIMDRVESYELEPDMRLPSVREFAALSGVNPNTVMRAYTWLQQEQIIYNQRGVGFFIEHYARDRVISMRREQFYARDIPQFVNRMIALNVPPAVIEEKYYDVLRYRRIEKSKK